MALWKEIIEKAMMRSVTERYILLKFAGMPHHELRQMNLNGSPYDCHNAILFHLDKMIDQGQQSLVESIIDFLGNKNIVPEELR